MRLIDLYEAVGRSAPLYHSTNLESIVNILTTNQLAADTSHAMMYINPVLRGKPEGNKKLAGVSLTRSKAFADDWADVVIVLDQEKIRHNKKLIPINYFNDEPDGSYSAQDREEFEEFVVGAVTPLDKFISGIYFPARLENDYTDYKWVVKNIKPYPDEYKGWLAVVNSPKYVGKPIRNMVEKKAVNELWLPGTEDAITVIGPMGKWERKAFENNDILITVSPPSKPISGVSLYIKKEKDESGNYVLFGWINTRVENDCPEYLSINESKILPPYRNKGYGKLMYQALLKYMNPKYKGIRSALAQRINKVEVPSIYKNLGGYEKDGYAYIDRTPHSQVTESLTINLNKNDDINYTFYDKKERVAIATIYRDRYDGQPAVEVGYFSVLPEFRNRGYGLKCLQLIKQRFNDVRYIIAEPMSQTILKLNIAAFGEPIMLGDDFDEFSVEEAMKRLPVSTTEDEDGELTNSYRIHTVYDLKKKSKVNEDTNQDKADLHSLLSTWEKGQADTRPKILNMLDQGKIPQEIRNSSHEIYRKIVITDAAFEKFKKNSKLKLNAKFPVSSWTESKEAAISFTPKGMKSGLKAIVVKKIAKESNIILNVNDASKYVGLRNFYQGEHEILILNDVYYFTINKNEVISPEL